MSWHHYTIWGKLTPLVLELVCLPLIVGPGCRFIPASQPDPASPGEGELPAIICQAGDFSGPDWTLDKAEAAAPRLEAYGPAVKAHRVLLGEHALANFSLACEIAVYEDEASAQRVFGELCAPGSSPTSPAIGEESCGFRGGPDEAPHHLIFRREGVLVLLWGDVGLESPAVAVDRRLQSGGL